MIPPSFLSFNPSFLKSFDIPFPLLILYLPLGETKLRFFNGFNTAGCDFFSFCFFFLDDGFFGDSSSSTSTKDEGEEELIETDSLLLLLS